MPIPGPWTQEDQRKNLIRINWLRFAGGCSERRRSLLRRDTTTAAKEIQLTDELFAELLEDKFAIASEQQELPELLVALEETSKLLEGFWVQVANSCCKIPGGQEIKVGQQILGFVEADSQQVILRNAGSNVVYQYGYLPPGLAVVLGNQGAVEDIPTWRMQQAAFYSLYVDQNSKYQEQVDQFLTLAELDGHDGTAVRRFEDFSWEIESVGVPESRFDLLEQEEFATAIEKFRELHGYDEPNQLPPKQADELAELLIAIEPANDKQRLAYLVEAQKLGIRSGNAFLVEDVVLELGVWAKVDTSRRLVTSFIELGKRKLDEVEARRLVETAIPLLKSPAIKSVNQQKKNRLIKRLSQIAEENEFVDSSRRLSQIE